MHQSTANTGNIGLKRVFEIEPNQQTPTFDMLERISFATFSAEPKMLD